MRGKVAKQLRKLAKAWMMNDIRVTDYRIAYQTLKKHYKVAKGG